MFWFIWTFTGELSKIIKIQFVKIGNFWFMANVLIKNGNYIKTKFVII